MASPEADNMIDDCDQAELFAEDGVELLRMPFSVWRAKSLPVNFNDQFMQLQLLPSLAAHIFVNKTEYRLFNHYVGHVAELMMPFKDSRNPWRALYPSIALQMRSRGQNAMINAMMSQAAFNLAYLSMDSQKMLSIGNFYYQESIQEFRFSMSHTVNYNEFIAATLTMMMAEVYSGHNRNWRIHFRGAWSYLLEQYRNGFLTDATMVFDILQSLFVINLVQDTSLFEQFPQSNPNNNEPTTEHEMVNHLTPHPTFGFTIGASNALLSCILKIKRLELLTRSRSKIPELDTRIYDVLVELQDSKALGIIEDLDTSPRYERISQCHLRAFRSATLIYFYRLLIAPPPSAIAVHVSDVFNSIDEFYRLGGGNLSLWPAFIASVEAYRDHDMRAANRWLANSINVGMGNRQMVQRTIEQVWRIRKEVSREMNQDRGSIAIDWREVMKKLDLDILLV